MQEKIARLTHGLKPVGLRLAQISNKEKVSTCRKFRQVQLEGNHAYYDFLESAMSDTNEQNNNKPQDTQPTETLSDGLVSRMELVEPLYTAGGAVLNELRLDFSKIRGRDYALISRIESRLKGDTLSLSVGSLNKQASPEWRCAVSWVAAIRGTKGLCLDDIDALSLHDLLALESEAIPFLVRSVSRPSSGTPSSCPKIAGSTSGKQ